MENAAFHTSVAKTGGTTGAAGKPAIAGAGKGVMALAGANFFDLMFARLATDPTSATASAQTGETALKGKNPLQNVKITELPGGALGISIEGKTVELTAETLQQALITTDQDTNLMDGVKAKKKFLDFLSSLLAGLPDGEKPAIDLSGKLTKKDLMHTAAQGEFPALVATGLSPEKLSEMMESFGRDVLQQYESNEEIQGVIVGLVKMMPPESKAPFDAIILPKALFVGKAGTTPDGQAAPTTSPATGQPAPTAPAMFEAAMNDLAPRPTATQPDGASGLLAGGKSADATALAAGTGGAIANGTSNNAAAITSFLSGLSFPFAGDLLAPQGWSDSIMDQFGLHPVGQHITSTGALTQAVTQAQHAAAPHPATQIVAAHMQKVGSTQDTRNLTLQLDPPELGRVEVRMQFNAKDKSVKAHMLVEKPETYFMLQRDSQVLERALQNAGLETSGNALNFELAQDGRDFSHNGRHDGQGSMAQGGDNGADGLEIIETTMNWFVDPESGMQRYNLLV